jgi:hypothetical protein
VLTAILAKQVYELRKLLPLALSITIQDRFFHTMRGMVLE